MTFQFISNDSLKSFSTMQHFVVTHSSGTLELIILISALSRKHGVHICFVLFSFDVVPFLPHAGFINQEQRITTQQNLF